MTIQKLMSHKALNTTMIYIYVICKNYSDIPSLLNRIWHLNQYYISLWIFKPSNILLAIKHG
jgi:hypothetical protein